MEEVQIVDNKKLKIARHETGHAVMALMCHRRIEKVSLREMDSTRGTDKYHGFMRLEQSERKIEDPMKESIQLIMIALAGGVGEGLFSENLAKIALDDMERAIEEVEKMLRVDEKFKSWIAGLPVPTPDALGMIKNPLIRTYIVKMVDECFQIMIPLKPVVQLIAGELLKREELTGDEVSALFNSCMQSIPGGDEMKRSTPIL